jgi:hypothetical protein
MTLSYLSLAGSDFYEILSALPIQNHSYSQYLPKITAILLIFMSVGIVAGII